MIAAIDFFFQLIILCEILKRKMLVEAVLIYVCVADNTKYSNISITTALKKIPPPPPDLSF